MPPPETAMFHAPEKGDDGDVVGKVLEVADEDDLVDAQREQAVDLGLNGRRRRGQIGGDGHVAGDGYPGQARGRRADQAEARARGRIVDDHGAPDHAAVGDGRLDEPVVIDEVGEAGLTGEVEVGAEEGLGLEAADEALEDIGRRVELVVADDVGVVGDGALGDGIEEGGALALTAEERGGGEVGVARVHRQDRVPGGPGLGDLALDDGPKAAMPATGTSTVTPSTSTAFVSGKEGGLAVVVVEEREGDLAVVLGGGDPGGRGPRPVAATSSATAAERARAIKAAVRAYAKGTSRRWQAASRRRAGSLRAAT